MCSFSCMILRQNIFNHMLSSSCVFQSVTGVIECLKIITREKSRRIAKFAFDYATKKGRNKVTAVHKANIMWVIFFFLLKAALSLLLSYFETMYLH